MKLFIPGPTNVHPEVLAKMGTPPIGHRTPEASALQKNISEKLQKLFYTKNKIILSTSSGTGLLEGAVRSLTLKKVIVFSVGAFGLRWHKIISQCGIDADLHEEEWGQALMPETVERYLQTGKYDTVAITHSETSTGVMNPLEGIAEVMARYPDVIFLVDAVSSAGGIKTEVDKMGIDLCITSSQKALALPPGFAVSTVSEKAEKRLQKIGRKGYYLDLLTILEFIEKKNYQYSSTPSLPHMYALDFQLDRILKEGLENRFTRHIEMAEYMINWTNYFFETYARPGFESLTVTCVKNTRKADINKLNEELVKRDMVLSNGYGKLKDQTFRVGHMGDMTLEDLSELTNAIEEILKLK